MMKKTRFFAIKNYLLSLLALVSMSLQADTLENGQEINNLSGSRGELLFFTVEIPKGTTDLAISLSGGTGDADLYVRQGLAPTNNQYHCRPYLSGNHEDCYFADPTPGIYYVLIKGYSDFSGLSLRARFKEHASEPEQVLGNGVAIEQLFGNYGASPAYYVHHVPEGATGLSIRVAGGQGDVDLYVRFGLQPSQTVFDCRPYRNGNDEICTIPEPKAGTYHIMLFPFSDYSGVTLTGQHSVAALETTSACVVSAQMQALLDAHNQVRAQGYCGYDPAPALTWHCALGQAAEVHSTDMATQTFVGHIGSNGSSPFERMADAGYNFSYAAENIAVGQTQVEEVMAAWLASPGHCQNIMNPHFTQLGASLVVNSNSYYKHYWTTTFAQPQ